MPVNASLKTVYEVPACSIQGHHCLSKGYPQVFSLPVQISKLRICKKNTTLHLQPLNQEITATWRICYTCNTFRGTLDASKKENFVSVIECCKSYHIVDCSVDRKESMALNGCCGMKSSEDSSNSKMTYETFLHWPELINFQENNSQIWRRLICRKS